MKKIGFLAALALLFACTPESNPLTGIALTEHEITLEKGGNKVLEVKFTPENATNKLLTWVSSNPSIVTVTDGVVVGVAPGSTEIIVNSGNLTDKCQVTVVISATSVSLDQPELILAPGETATLKATVLPDDSTDEVEWSSSDETVATVQDGVVSAVASGTATMTAKAGNHTDKCAVIVKAPDPAKNVIVAVDLGLSVKWGSVNLGAENSEDYGDYYAWGETEPKENYSWGTYKFGTSKSGPFSKYNTISSYGTIDNKTVLEPEDDVASVKLGGNWRMPTDEEWTELRTKCTWTWTTQNEVNGRLVTASNGNSIFLPAGGSRDNSRDDTGLGGVGSYGLYRSSSLTTDDPYCAWSAGFYSGNVFRSSIYRCIGRSVRPVSE